MKSKANGFCELSKRWRKGYINPSFSFLFLNSTFELFSGIIGERVLFGSLESKKFKIYFDQNFD